MDSKEESDDTSSGGSSIDVKSIGSGLASVESDGLGSQTVTARYFEKVVKPKKVVENPFPYEAKQDYLNSLSQEKLEMLNHEARKMRDDPTLGSDDWETLLHVNMQDHDNLYIVCYTLENMTEDTIQIVQADPYERWQNDDSVKNLVDMKKGEWWCTSLQPYWKDEDQPIEHCRWRYQTHGYYPKTNKLTLGFYSFDDRTKRSKGEKDTMMRDWSEELCLKKSGRFLYGPFSWEDKSEFRISRLDWEKALPAVLKAETKKGTLFWQGFSDALLLKAGASEEHIADCKKKKSELADCPNLPVLFNEINRSRALGIVRVNKQKKPRKDTCPLIWKYPKRARGRPSEDARIGAYMQVLSSKKRAEKLAELELSSPTKTTDGK
jgi:hypothetical protein